MFGTAHARECYAHEGRRTPEEGLQFRIQIRDIEPPIYRVIQVTNDWTFHLLHEALQVTYATGGGST
jgi:Plasmid pRiA4b ORF-3-like protein